MAIWPVSIPLSIRRKGSKAGGWNHLKACSPGAWFGTPWLLGHVPVSVCPLQVVCPAWRHQGNQTCYIIARAPKDCVPREKDRSCLKSSLQTYQEIYPFYLSIYCPVSLLVSDSRCLGKIVSWHRCFRMQFLIMNHRILELEIILVVA